MTESSGHAAQTRRLGGKLEPAPALTVIPGASPITRPSVSTQPDRQHFAAWESSLLTIPTGAGPGASGSAPHRIEYVLPPPFGVPQHPLISGYVRGRQSGQAGRSAELNASIVTCSICSVVRSVLSSAPGDPATHECA